MSQWVPPDGSVVDEFVTTAESGSMQRKPRLASVTRRLRPGEAGMEEALAAGEQAAADAGWNRTADLDARFTRDGEGARLDMSILGYDAEGTDIVVKMVAVPR